MPSALACMHVELDEFDSLADAEKYIARMDKDEGYMKLYQEALQLVVPATYSLNVWKALE